MLKKICHYLDDNIEYMFLCFFGLICLISVLLQIITRTFRVSLPWTEEVSRYCLVWITFWGMSYGSKRRGHIRFELLLNSMNGKARIISEIFISLFLLVIYSFVFYYSIKFVKSSGQLAPALNISKNIVNISAPIGIGFCILRTLQQIVFAVKTILAKEY